VSLVWFIFYIICNLFGMPFWVDIIVMFVMRMVDKKIMIVCMVSNLVVVSSNLGYSKRLKYWFPFWYFCGTFRKMKNGR